MICHILNGDGLAEKFPAETIGGEVVICRECLIDGEVNVPDLKNFFETRAEFIASVFGESKKTYFERVVSEFEKMISLPDDSEVNLWFEDDLFCQVNMWFVITVLNSKLKNLRLNRVFPRIITGDDQWKGFGLSEKQDLVIAYGNRVLFDDKSIELGNELWSAYRNGSLKKLDELSKQTSQCFRNLGLVCKAHTEKMTNQRPQNSLIEILQSGNRDFPEIFSEFSKREGIYGFGDLQVKNMIKEIVQ